MRFLVVNEEGDCLNGGEFVPREQADLFPLEVANLEASRLNATVIEATATEFLRFIGRQGGRKRSLKKTMAVRKNGRIRHL